MSLGNRGRKQSLYNHLEATLRRSLTRPVVLCSCVCNLGGHMESYPTPYEAGVSLYHVL